MLGFVKKHTIAVALATALVVTATTGTALAVLTTGSGGTIRKVDTRAENAPTISNAVGFNLVPGTVTAIDVPNGEQALITARFTAESRCRAFFAAAVGNQCRIRILVDGLQMFPADNQAAFDSVNSSVPEEDFEEGHAVERDRTVGPGNHVIQVQRAVQAANTFFTLDDYHLTVEQSQRVS